MRAVVQRVKDCSVTVDDKIIDKIDAGLLVYLGIGNDDTMDDVHYTADKILNLRIFDDSDGKMNLSLLDMKGYGIIVVSQFTLYGDTRRGRRPSYSNAAPVKDARKMYEDFLHHLETLGLKPGRGEFQASMKVTYTNNGPVTILIDSRKQF
ncbi:MAG: D-aminoacyl-tRNA deacylase [Spirochaetota bacterium]